MKRIILLSTLVAFACSFNVLAKGAVDVIPQPQTVNVSEKMAKASDLCSVFAAKGLENELEAYVSGAKLYAGVDVEKKCRCSARVKLSLKASLAEEEYTLTVRKKRVIIRGGSAKAVFYGIQTLLQEFNAYEGAAKIGKISDCSRYSWRGYMLDESRHFFGEEKVLQTLDLMAFYKLNKFHWHLTDAGGWRIEIKAYPELTTVGAIGNHTDPSAPATFYTQEQIRRVVEYAAARHIDVVPEIDMPGHASAATRAYPELGVWGKGRAEGEDSFTFNPGKDEVYSFLSTVLAEVVELFPYEYLHIGGDEVALGNQKWAEDPYIGELIAREGIDNGIKGAEGFFLKRITPIVEGLGRKMVAWDDVVSLGAGHLGTALSWWRHDKLDHLYKGLEQGYEMILCPRLPLYLDFVQDADQKVGRKWAGGFCPMPSLYEFPESLFEKWADDAPAKDGITGMQINLWTETVHTAKRMDFMTYPRICAFAESAWTAPQNKDYDSFCQRLEASYRLFDSLGLYYCDYRNPSNHPEVEK